MSTRTVQEGNLENQGLDPQVVEALHVHGLVVEVVEVGAAHPRWTRGKWRPELKRRNWWWSRKKGHLWIGWDCICPVGVRYRAHYGANKHLIDTFPEDKHILLVMNHTTNMAIIGKWAIFFYPHLEKMVECGSKISYSRRCWSSFKLFPCKAGVPASFFIFSAWKGTERK